jgi:hypothetical protein
MRGWRAGLTALCVLAAIATSARAGEPARIVMLSAFNGLPPDSASRGAFLDAFQAEFDADQLPLQKRSGEHWDASGERVNRFRLVDLAAPGDAWSLDVTIGLPPPVVLATPKKKESDPTPRPRYTDYRAARGLTMVATAIRPAGSTPDTPEPLKLAVYFPDARRVVVPSPKLPGGAYAYPWAEAGRVVARFALEVLHRADDVLADDERADLAPAVRAEETP